MRLIDADALKNDLTRFYNNAVTAKQLIDEQPTVDAAPVVHGRWVHHKGGYSDHYECTVCGEGIVLTARFRYCSNCGAKMDGDENAVD